MGFTTHQPFTAAAYAAAKVMPVATATLSLNDAVAQGRLTFAAGLYTEVVPDPGPPAPPTPVYSGITIT